MDSDKRDNFTLHFSAAALLLIATIGRAEEPSSAIHGSVDTYFAWNSNRPDNHKNFIPGTGTTAVHANAVALNLAAVEFVRAPKPFGYHVTLVGGDGANVVHAGEPGVHGHHRVRNLYQASVLYSKQKLTLEGGVYPSHIGFEGFFSKDNWNYTRGWLGELSPYYQAGLKAAYTWNDRWSGQVHLLQGWQLIHDNNHAKSIGTQITYSGDPLSVSLNTLVGPELTSDNKHVRLFGDVVATYKATPRLTAAASLDRGRQELPGSTYANWLGASLWGRYVVDARQVLAARADWFRDPDNGISGFAQTLTSLTATYEFDPSKNVILKIEGRRDHSTIASFSRRDGKSNNQTLLILGTVVRF